MNSSVPFFASMSHSQVPIPSWLYEKYTLGCTHFFVKHNHIYAYTYFCWLDFLIATPVGDDFQPSEGIVGRLQEKLLSQLGPQDLLLLVVRYLWWLGAVWQSSKFRWGLQQYISCGTPTSLPVQSHGYLARGAYNTLAVGHIPHCWPPTDSGRGVPPNVTIVEITKSFRKNILSILTMKHSHICTFLELWRDFHPHQKWKLSKSCKTRVFQVKRKIFVLSKISPLTHQRLPLWR